MLQNLPAKLQYTGNLWQETESARTVMTAHVHLDFLYNEFMLRRLLYLRHRDNYTELLELSQRMLNIVLETCNIRACQSPNADHIPWIVILYGLPPAGLLAVELLRRKDQTEPNCLRQLGSLKFSWTQVLQDLAVFNSVLKWMHLPWEGNYELANEAHQSLQRVLRKVLSVDESTNDHQLQQFEPENRCADRGAVGVSNTVSLQEMETESNTPLYSRFQDIATDNLDWDVTMGFDVDFWMDLPDSLQV